VVWKEWRAEHANMHVAFFVIEIVVVVVVDCLWSFVVFENKWKIEEEDGENYSSSPESRHEMHDNDGNLQILA
jgi:hypothetical protein